MILAWTIGFLGGLLIILGMASYKKARPDQALIISGLKKRPKVVVGKASIALPFLQRVDTIGLSLIQIDVRANRIPTKEFINISVDAVANVQVDTENIDLAVKNFLNKPADYIRDTVQQVLEGNMREIIGQMELRSLVNQRDEFAQKVQENVTDDMARIGMKVINFNVQNFTDENHAIEDLGVDNLAKIQKDAKIAKAQADRDVQIETAKAQQEGNKARVESDKLIAAQERDLKLAQAEAKAKADDAIAKAEAAKEIQQKIQNKTINEKEVEAQTARAEKQLELREREIALVEKELDAKVKKTADAERYAAEQKFEAEKIERIKKAEAEREAMLLEAEGIKAKGLAEAQAIKAKKLAEAEGVEKLAEAQAKMESASIVQMVMDKLPEIAKEVSAPLGKVNSITMYDPNGTTKLLENGTKGVGQVIKVAEQAGVDLKSLVAGFLGAKVIENKDEK